MRAARWLIRWLVPQRWRESLLGDLVEEAARRRARGLRAGPVWAVGTATIIAARLAIEGWRWSAAAGPRTPLGNGLAGDVRTAWRSLRAAPSFSLAVIAVFALGVGVTTAIFTVADVLLLRPAPFTSPETLMVVGERDRQAPPPYAGYVGTAAIQNVRDWEAAQTVFAGFAATVSTTQVVREGGDPERLVGLRASASLFDVLGVAPALGTRLSADHEVPGRDAVVLISDRLWRQRFGADPLVVGKRLTLESGPHEIIGVLPPGFQFPLQQTRPTDFLLPLTRSERQRVRDRTQTGRTYNVLAVGRLRAGATPAHATEEFERLTANLEREYPDWFEDQTLAIAPLQASVVGRTRHWMLLLLGTVGAVLLVACANLMNLQLARAAARTRDAVVRVALGAGVWRLVRSALVEALLLSGAGLAAALCVAAWGVAALRAALPSSVPRMAEMALDGRVLVFAASVTLLVGVTSGLLPAMLHARVRGFGVMQEGGRGGTAGPARLRLRAGLVVGEVALALLLVIGAGLFVTSFLRVLRVDLGMDVRNVVTVDVYPRIAGPAGATAAETRAYIEQRARAAIDEALVRLQAVPGVEAVAAVGSGSPISGGWRTNALTVPGKPAFTAQDDQVQIKEVTPAYKEVLRVPLRRGRYIASGDTATAPLVVVLNEEAVRRFFDGQDPIGAVVLLDDAAREVIGVVGNVRVRGPEVPIAPEAYLPFDQRPARGATLVARTTRSAEGVLPDARTVALAVAPGVPVTPRTMESALEDLVAPRRFNMLLIGLFGALALAIAGIGIYGVMAFLVAQQTREIGVRMALGARPLSVSLHVLRRAGTYTAAGLTLGLAAAWWLAGSLEAFLFEVRSHDPWVFAGAAAVLGLTALLAGIIPALRAARIDPITALRAD